MIVFSSMTSNFDRFSKEAGCFFKIVIIDDCNRVGFGADWQVLQCPHTVLLFLQNSQEEGLDYTVFRFRHSPELL